MCADACDEVRGMFWLQLQGARTTTSTLTIFAVFASAVFWTPLSHFLFLSFFVRHDDVRDVCISALSDGRETSFRENVLLISGSRHLLLS